ncbi:MAG: glycoside hydrolase family 25 protein [Flavobacterium sp.]|nr:glycoside hydrolase family 25 protein [Flavobacterium sp.]
MANRTTRKTVVRKKPIKSKSSSFSQRFYIFISLFIVLIVISIHYRETISYYFGFKSDKIFQENKITKERIFQVLNSHKDFVYGFDVSEFQGQIHWDQIDSLDQKFPLHFVFIRATAGSDKKDSRFDENWEQSKLNHFIRGAYHYYRPNENSVAQATNFINAVKLTKGDFPPILDIEQMPENQSLDSLKAGLKRWLKIVDKHYEVKPIIYTNEKYYTDFLKKDFPKYKFWIANYNSWVLKIDDDWLFWQFTDKGKLNGINEKVDINIYNGTPKMMDYIILSN